MEFEIGRKAFLDLLQRAWGGPAKGVALPILHHVLLSADGDDVLRAASTDLSLTFEAFCEEARIVQSGRVLLPYKEALRILKALRGDLVTVRVGVDNVGNVNILLACGKAEIVLVGWDVEEYPLLPTIAVGDKILAGWQCLQLKSEVLEHILKHLVPVASEDANRPVLRAVHFHSADGMLLVEVTDGRLLERIEYDLSVGSFPEILVSAEDLSWAGKCYKKNKGSVRDISLFTNGEHICFCFSDRRVYCKLEEGPYVDVPALLAKMGQVEYYPADRDLLAEAVSLADAFKAEYITFEFPSSGMTLKTVRTTRGMESSLYMDAAWHLDYPAFGLAQGYLKQVLSLFPGGGFKFGFGCGFGEEDADFISCAVHFTGEGLPGCVRNVVCLCMTLRL